MHRQRTRRRGFKSSLQHSVNLKALRQKLTDKAMITGPLRMPSRYALDTRSQVTQPSLEQLSRNTTETITSEMDSADINDWMCTLDSFGTNFG